MSNFNLETIQDLFINATEEHVNLSEIILDAGTQQRSKINAQAVENYSEAMLDGQAPEFPPVKLIRLNEPVTLPDSSILEIGTLILADGFHRLEAAVSAKLGTFQSLIADGSLQDAIYYSMTANSTNGVNLQGKDYQNAIKKLYTLDGGYWREHGRKKEIAALFGCSTKTVERATSAIDKATKAEAFKLFEQGASLNEVAEISFKSLKTIKEWFAEWEESKAKDKPNNDGESGSGESGSGEHTNAGDNNPLDLTFTQVLALKDSDLKLRLLKLLMDSCGIKADTKEETKEPEQEDDVPPFETDEEPKGTNDNTIIDELVKQWKGKDWWDILGLDLIKLKDLSKPAAAIKRAYNKQLKQCHSDKFGENEALDILKNAMAESKKMYK